MRGAAAASAEVPDFSDNYSAVAFLSFPRTNLVDVVLEEGRVLSLNSSIKSGGEQFRGKI